MKHIKKRYLFQEKLDKSKRELIDTIGEKLNKEDKDLIIKSKHKNLFITTDKDFMVKAFALNHNGIKMIIPIPDLSLVYFDSAYNLNVLREEKKKDLIPKISLNSKELDEDATNEIYKYYGYSSSCIISLFTSLESFINHILPNDKLYVRELNNKTESFTKEQIQKGIKFNDKTRKVLPFFFNGKNFFRNKSLANKHIDNLKELRDELVHPKSDQSFQSQEKLITRLLAFKYEETFEAVKKLMNFYIENFIEECDCGVDY